MITIHALFIGQPKTIADAQGTWRSSIYRDRVDEPVQLELDGLVGDRAAQPYHGELDSAIYCHLLDHYRFWNEHYGMQLRPGNVGENFALENAAASIMRSTLTSRTASWKPKDCLITGRSSSPRSWLRPKRIGLLK